MGRLAIPLLLCALGCESLINPDGVDPGECNAPEDCFDDQTCNILSRCVPKESVLDIAELDTSVDASVRDIAVPDMEIVDRALPDVGVDPMPFGPLGERCFTGDRGEGDRIPAGNHVPLTLCGPHGLAWTVPGAAGAELHYLRTPGGVVQTGPVVGDDLARRLNEGRVIYARPGPISTIATFDLRTGEELTVADVGLDQRTPASHHDRIAWVQESGTLSQVVLKVEQGTIDCGRRGKIQWGVELGPDSMAFFERRPDSHRTKLIITNGLECDATRVAVPLNGVIPDDARITEASGSLFWIQADEGTRQVWTLDLSAIGDLSRPFAAVDLIAPVDIIAYGAWLMVVGYQPSGHIVKGYDIGGGASVVVSRGNNNLRPTLSASFVTWAAQAAGLPWEVHYARLDAF